MQLVFFVQPVSDLARSVAFHRDTLGLEEAWREGEDTVAFRLPDQSVQLMLTTDGSAAGPMYLVDDLDAWTAEHGDLTVVAPRQLIPDGAVTGFEAPGGGAFHVFDQPGSPA